jgi:hypothetical protein
MSVQDSNNTAPRHWAAGDWLAGGVLDPLLEINAQCVELLCSMAQAQSAALPMLVELAPLWRSLSDEGRRRLAQSPYLLVDAGFNDEARWRRLQRHGVNDQPRDLRAGCFPSDRAPGFARRVLVYGWHLARAHRSVARIALGMTPTCLDRIAELSLRDLDWVCEQHPGWVRPRWEAQPLVWRQMLAAAVNADGAALQQASLRGIQLLAAGALGPRGQA